MKLCSKYSNLINANGYLYFDIRFAVSGSGLATAFSCNDLYNVVYKGSNIIIYKMIHGNTIGAYHCNLYNFGMPLMIIMSELT